VTELEESPSKIPQARREEEDIRARRLRIAVKPAYPRSDLRRVAVVRQLRSSCVTEGRAFIRGRAAPELRVQVAGLIVGRVPVVRIGRRVSPQPRDEEEERQSEECEECARRASSPFLLFDPASAGDLPDPPPRDCKLRSWWGENGTNLETEWGDGGSE
jgi:hypothetical protein